MINFPALKYKGDSSSGLKADLIAALTVVIMIIPQGMAYATLAGFPPIYGLYTCLVPLFIYPFFGTSKFLSVGPVALVSILLISGLSLMAEPFTEEYIQMGIFVGLAAGVIQLLFSVLRLGSLVNFLSLPVLSGFTSAAAIIIITSQLSACFGLTIERGGTVFESLLTICQNLGSSDIPSVFICSLSILFILLMKKVWKAFPSSLFVVVLSSLMVHVLHLNTVRVVGSVPSGLPQLINPFTLDSNTMLSLLPLSLVIALICFVGSLAIVKSLESKHGVHRIDSNRELLGLGIAKMAGAFLQSIPSTGSFSRSAVNESVGGKSGWSSAFAAIIIAVCLLLFTHLFAYIPYPVLAAIIISAVIKLIDWKEAKNLFYSDRADFWVWMMTFLATLIFGIQLGVIAGIVLSICMILKKVSSPHFAVLGKIDDSGIYRNIDRFDHAQTEDDVLIIRYDDDIFFGNAEHFFDAVTSELSQRPQTKHLVLDVSSVTNIDSTGVKKLKLLISIVKQNNIEIHYSGPKGPLRDRLQQEGLFEAIGKSGFHHNIEKTLETLG